MTQKIVIIGFPKSPLNGVIVASMTEAAVNGMTLEQAQGLQARLATSDEWLPDLMMTFHSVRAWDVESGAEVPHIHHVPLKALVQVDAAGPFVVVDGTRHAVMPHATPQDVERDDESMTAWLVKQVRRRNQRHAKYQRQHRHLSVAPMGMVDLVPGVHGPRDPKDQRLANVAKVAKSSLHEEQDALGKVLRKYGRVEVSFTELTRQRIGELRRRSKRADPTMMLPFDVVHVEGGADLQAAALSRLSCFDTRTLKVLLACMDMGWRRGGVFPAAPSEIMKVLGIDPGTIDGGTRRRIEEDLRLLMDAEIRLAPIGSSEGDVKQVTLKLLVQEGTVRMRGVKHDVPLMRVGMALWDPMQHRGKGLVFDPRILMSDEQQHEWHLRLYLHLAGAWSLGWVKQDRLRNGGGIRCRLRDLLNGAGVEWRDRYRDRGIGWLLDRVAGVLGDLQKWERGGLVGDWTLERGADVDACFVEVKAPADLTVMLNDRRAPALAAKGRPR